MCASGCGAMAHWRMREGSAGSFVFGTLRTGMDARGLLAGLGTGPRWGAGLLPVLAALEALRARWAAGEELSNLDMVVLLSHETAHDCAPVIGVRMVAVIVLERVGGGIAPALHKEVSG